MNTMKISANRSKILVTRLFRGLAHILNFLWYVMAYIVTILYYANFLLMALFSYLVLLPLWFGPVTSLLPKGILEYLVGNGIGCIVVFIITTILGGVAFHIFFKALKNIFMTFLCKDDYLYRSKEKIDKLNEEIKEAQIERKYGSYQNYAKAMIDEYRKKEYYVGDR